MVKAQFNPSTLKAIYNAETGKQQVAVRDDFVEPPRDVVYSEVDCVWCNENETPYQVTVKFSGITLCDGCYPAPASQWNKWIETFDPNGLYLCTQREENPCQWRGLRIPITEIYDRYWDSNCTNFNRREILEDPTYNIIVLATKTAEGKIAITMHITTVGGYSMFEAIDVAPDSNCMTIGTPANNKFTAEDCSYTREWSAGAVEIREGDQTP